MGQEQGEWYNKTSVSPGKQWAHFGKMLSQLKDMSTGILQQGRRQWLQLKSRDRKGKRRKSQREIGREKTSCGSWETYGKQYAKQMRRHVI
jgi:hypothetical protein